MNEILQAIFPIAARHTNKIPNATIQIRTKKTHIEENITIEWPKKLENNRILKIYYIVVIRPDIISITSRIASGGEIGTWRAIENNIIHTIPLTDPQAIQKLEQYLEEHHQ